MNIYQFEISIKPKPRGFSLITGEIEKQIPALKNIKRGIAHIFIMHTSAGLTVNENADPSVRRDFETFFNRLVPEDTSMYEHTAEGADDMVSHIKNSLLGSSVTLPVKDGHFHTGTWQGIYLCEFRNRSRNRNLTVTIFGE